MTVATACASAPRTASDELEGAGSNPVVSKEVCLVLNWFDELERISLGSSDLPTMAYKLPRRT